MDYRPAGPDMGGVSKNRPSSTRRGSPVSLQLVEQPPFELRSRARIGRVGGDVLHLIRVGFQVVQLLAGPLAVGPLEVRLPARVVAMVTSHALVGPASSSGNVQNVSSVSSSALGGLVAVEAIGVAQGPAIGPEVARCTGSRASGSPAADRACNRHARLSTCRSRPVKTAVRRGIDLAGPVGLEHVDEAAAGHRRRARRRPPAPGTSARGRSG